MQALILSGGFGVRLKEVIHGRPKAMAPIGDKPFLEHLIRRLKKKGMKEFVLAVGYLADYVKDYFGDGRRWRVNIVYSEDNRPLGTAGAIKHAEKFLRRPFLAINGDTYVDFSPNALAQFHKNHKAIVTTVISKHDHGRGGLVALGKNDEITGFQEQTRDTEKQPEKSWANAGVYMVNPRVFPLMKKGLRASLEKDIFPKLMRAHMLYGYRVRSDYIDIGSPAYYRKAKVLLLKDVS